MKTILILLFLSLSLFAQAEDKCDIENYRDFINKKGVHKCDLREADLRGANLHRANLHRANLYKADLRGADLYRAVLIGAKVTKAQADYLRSKGYIGGFVVVE